MEQMPSHSHDVRCKMFTGGSGYDYVFDRKSTYTDPTTETGGSQSHTHGLSGSTDDRSSLPPYFALALIMRVS